MLYSAFNIWIKRPSNSATRCLQRRRPSPSRRTGRSRKRREKQKKKKKKTRNRHPLFVVLILNVVWMRIGILKMFVWAGSMWMWEIATARQGRLRICWMMWWLKQSRKIWRMLYDKGYKLEKVLSMGAKFYRFSVVILFFATRWIFLICHWNACLPHLI